MIEPTAHFLQRCVSVDLEVDPATALVFAFAAVRDGSPAIVAKKANIESGLDRLEAELSGATHILGHNIIRHDLPHLAAIRPRLQQVFEAPIDTLWLNPLAFPRNPYHQLIKHYHDAPRRLFYVAMTRARRSLTIMADAAHPFVPPGDKHVLRRTAPPVAPDSTATTAYQVPDLKTVDLSWAGRLGGGNPALAAIKSAKAGDPIHLTRRDDTWVLETLDGQPLGRMARSWSPPQGLAFVRGEIGAIIRWRKTDTGEEYRDNMRRDEWEVVVPELGFG